MDESESRWHDDGSRLRISRQAPYKGQQEQRCVAHTSTLGQVAIGTSRGQGGSLQVPWWWVACRGLGAWQAPGVVPGRYLTQSSDHCSHASMLLIEFRLQGVGDGAGWGPGVRSQAITDITPAFLSPASRLRNDISTTS